jgi:hypothetical protein
MAHLPTFLNGTECLIEIGNPGVKVAEAQMISFQEQVSNALTFGMGDYGAITNEPLLYTGSGGSIRILRYSDTALQLQDKKGLNNNLLVTAVAQQGNVIHAADIKGSQDGNSLAFTTSFSPAHLLLESTFDIKIFVRTGPSTAEPLYILHDCIMTGWSLAFAIGSQASEDYSFICRMVESVTAEPNKATNNP